MPEDGGEAAGRARAIALEWDRTSQARQALDEPSVRGRGACDCCTVGAEELGRGAAISRDVVGW